MGGECATRAARSAQNAIWKRFAIRKTRRFKLPHNKNKEGGESRPLCFCCLRFSESSLHAAGDSDAGSSAGASTSRERRTSNCCQRSVRVDLIRGDRGRNASAVSCDCRIQINTAGINRDFPCTCGIDRDRSAQNGQSTGRFVEGKDSNLSGGRIRHEHKSSERIESNGGWRH